MQLKSSPTVAVEKKDLSCLASIFSRSHTQKRHSFKSKCLINRRFKRDVEAMGFLLKKTSFWDDWTGKTPTTPRFPARVKKKEGKNKGKESLGCTEPRKYVSRVSWNTKSAQKNKLTIGAREQPRCKEYPETRQKYKNQQMRNYGNQFEMHFSIIFRGHKNLFFL